MDEEKYITCYLEIKKGQATYSYSDWNRRNEELAKIQAQLHKDFYVILNKIVALGGVLLVDKNKLDYESEYVSDGCITIYIPEKAFQVLKEHPMVHRIAICE